MSSICRNAPYCCHPICIEILILDDDVDEAAFASFLQAVQYGKKHFVKQPKRNSSLSGHMWMRELWEGNPIRFHEQMRMSKDAMASLLHFLQSNCGLRPYGRLDLLESVGMFLKFVGSGATYTEVEERFQHSGETVWRHFYHVLEPMCILGDLMIQPSENQFADVPEKIRIDSRYYPYFDGCVGAIDGTHVVLRLPPTQGNIVYLNRKGRFSTNILAICDFNMCFIYADVGKDGSQHDAGILAEVMHSTIREFPFPPLGKYYLADSSFGLNTGFLTPYRNTRYHLPDFHVVGVIRTREENFNYAHSSLRSIIERSFGVLKARFRILNHMLTMRKSTQIQTIWACIGLHNFLRRYAVQDLEFIAPHIMQSAYVPGTSAVDAEEDLTEDPNIVDNETMAVLRDSIRDALPFE